MAKTTFVTPEIIRHIVDTIVQAVNPKKIMVFGSCAREEAQWDSDLDLFVVMNTDLSFVDRALEIRNLFEQVPCPLDIVVYTPAEVAYWRTIPSSFVYQIFAEGRLLYDRTSEAVGQTVDTQTHLAKLTGIEPSGEVCPTVGMRTSEPVDYTDDAFQPLTGEELQDWGL